MHLFLVHFVHAQDADVKKCYKLNITTANVTYKIGYK